MYPQVIDDAPAIKELMNSLYNCKYRDFFVALVAVVDQLLLDRYLAPHATFFLRQVPCSTAIDMNVPVSVLVVCARALKLSCAGSGCRIQAVSGIVFHSVLALDGRHIRGADLFRCNVLISSLD